MKKKKEEAMEKSKKRGKEAQGEVVVTLSYAAEVLCGRTSLTSGITGSRCSMSSILFLSPSPHLPVLLSPEWTSF